jgi:drug/metabolite transporter (DMT)-like permease
VQGDRDGSEGQQRRAVGFALASVACWSTVATAFKLALRGMDVHQLLLVAHLTAALALLAITVLRGRLGALWLLLRERGLTCLLLGLLNPVAYYLVLFAAYDRLPAQVAQPLNYTWAIALALLSVPLLGQRIAGRDWIAAAVAYAGVVVITAQGGIGGEDLDPFGILLALGSTLLWALYWIANTRVPGDAQLRLTLNFLLSLPVTVLIAAQFSAAPQPAAAALAAAVWVGLLEMAIPFVTWQLALNLSSNTARVGNLIFLSPFLSLQLIHFVLDEPVRPATYLGLVLILAGLLLQRR